MTAVVWSFFLLRSSFIPPGDAGDEKLLREAKVGTDGPALLDYFRRHTMTAAQRGRLRGLVPRLGDDDFRARQKASADLVVFGPAAVPHLRRALDDPDEEVRERLRAALATLEPRTRPAISAAAARLLRTRAPAGAVPVLLAYLPEADGAVEDEVIATLAVLGAPEGKVLPALADARADAEPTRRAAAAAVLGRWGTPEQRAAVRALLADPRPAVRFRAAQGLLAARDRAALPTLAALVGDAPLPLAFRADELLACVAGRRAPRLHCGDPAGRRHCRTAWESWLRVSGAADLGRADVDLPPANPSLRAAAAARDFVADLLAGDRDAVREATDVPFLVADESSNLVQVTARGELDKLLVTFTQNLREQGWSAAGLATRFTDGLPNTSGTTLRARSRKGEVRAVALLRPAPAPGADLPELVLLVRLTGDRPRVIGAEPRITTLMK
jgi:hypothetical protein